MQILVYTYSTYYMSSRHSHKIIKLLPDFNNHYLHALYSVYYRDTAITLLRLIKKQNNDAWLQTIKHCVTKKNKNKKIDPLTMLIKEMPGIISMLIL